MLCFIAGIVKFVGKLVQPQFSRLNFLQFAKTRQKGEIYTQVVELIARFDQTELLFKRVITLLEFSAIIEKPVFLKVLGGLSKKIRITSKARIRIDFTLPLLALKLNIYIFRSFGAVHKRRLKFFWPFLTFSKSWEISLLRKA